MEQIPIAMLGVTATFLAMDEKLARRRWACLFGLAAQPFWFYSTYKAQQWGMFCLCFLYTWAWWRGVWVNWLKKPSKPNEAIGEIPH